MNHQQPFGLHVREVAESLGLGLTVTNHQQRFGLRVREVAQALGLGLTVTRRLVKDGSIKSLRIGKCVVVTPAAIADFLAAAAGGAR